MCRICAIATLCLEKLTSVHHTTLCTLLLFGLIVHQRSPCLDVCVFAYIWCGVKDLVYNSTATPFSCNVYLHICCEQVLFLVASVCLTAQNLENY